jgi:hypothetical protein
LESLGNSFGLGEDDDGGVVSESLQEIIPIKKMKPSKYFMVKKYGFSCLLPKTPPHGYRSCVPSLQNLPLK